MARNAVRFRRGRQHPQRRRAVGKAEARGRGRKRGLGTKLGLLPGDTFGERHQCVFERLAFEVRVFTHAADSTPLTARVNTNSRAGGRSDRL
jgi:hypothetical protein